MFKPLHDKILIKRASRTEKTGGGILLPETVEQESMEGVIVAVGPGRYENGERIPPVVKVGDKVLFGKWAAKDVVINKEKFAIMREDDIIGILKDI